MKEKEQDSFYKWVALCVVVIGTFMSVLDSSIVNISIPKMMAVYGVSLDKIKWVLTSYMLTLGSVIPLTGYLADKFGTKKLYIFALFTFTLGSLLCGLSPTANAMIISRIIQGIGGGMIMPVSMSIIYEIIPKEERGMALGFWGIAAMAAPAVGPTLSGYIIQNLDWRLIFTINIPIGVLGVILSAILLKDGAKKENKSFDFLGLITSTVGIVSILYVLGEGSSIDWGDIKNVLLLVIGSFSFIVFIINELTLDNPLLDLRLLKIFPFTLSIIISSVLGMALFGGVYILPLFLQNIRGYTAMQTGMLMFPSAIATGIMMPISGKLFDKIGAKPLVIPGVILLTITTFELSKIGMDTSAATIRWILVIRGIALGITMMPSTTAGMNSVPQALVARASALSNTIRQIASSLSVTIISMLLQRTQSIGYYRVIEQITPSNYVAMGYLKSLPKAISSFTIYGFVQKQVFMAAINDTLLFTVYVAAAIIPLALLIPKKKEITK